MSFIINTLCYWKSRYLRENIQSIVEGHKQDYHWLKQKINQNCIILIEFTQNHYDSVIDVLVVTYINIKEHKHWSRKVGIWINTFIIQSRWIISSTFVRERLRFTTDSSNNFNILYGILYFVIFTMGRRFRYQIFKQRKLSFHIFI